ncbi:Hsp70 family protein [Tardiphaga sp. vice352]|uniref:Hsp70 family protein n=1 Tax=unclassified Tardiphaga TaxID=2631404 RepID=UPI00116459EF|nr:MULTISPECIES: Hsp70 family protein [unclassified Tardiphaga]MBC7586178.1 Hsp70 family protein [Tardiphaga sp.]QDM18792.1 Hsp70 family protein [Tardiphaga sp. vice278]QDM24650.1 Hsp70 family protein [Tardiphaga sp. vice154]QDM29842.1 Hsp70 family protein [Tardiphaga sp. vice304]QDM34108.1 Hsp70 family protein [Tardiphaga sp. vice352]
MSTCGLDFGTSNTTLGTLKGDVPVLAELEAGHTTIPSAIFFEADGATLIGRRAIEAYVEGTSGRLMRSLKSVLGTSLIDETTRTGRERISFRDIIAWYLTAVKRRAETATGKPLRNVVHGRPVHFVDNNEANDRKAEATLRDIATEVGFEQVTFQFEPIAAALDYERTLHSEQIALIADIGGGTSDFSIVRLSPERHLKAERQADILANDGVRIGGTDFDRQLSLGVIMPLLGYRTAMKRAGLDVPSGYFHDLATWSNINRMYESKVMNEVRQVRYEAKQPELLDRLVRVLDEQRGHTLAMEIEDAKIALSSAPNSSIALDWIEPGLKAGVARKELVGHTTSLADRITARIGICLEQAGLQADDIDAVFLTGGSVQLAHVRKAITSAVPNARAIEGDTFGAVGKGLTIEAVRRYGPG